MAKPGAPVTAIVRVMDADGATAGTGFLALQDGTIATCAHVVDAAADASGLVRVVFAGRDDRSPRIARVDQNARRPAAAEDVAFLALDGALPDDARPISLSSSIEATGRTFHTFGFPTAKSVEGLVGELYVVGETTEAGFRVLQTRSSEVTLGFSGAPVWDDEGRAIGQVVSTIPAGVDPAGKQWDTSFVTPVETLIEIRRDLRPPDVAPYRGLEAFDEEHADWYFGREAAAARLAELLAVANVVAVTGVSGSGKSSLVRAGLKKQLEEDAIPGLVERHRCVFRVGAAPLLALMLELARTEIGAEAVAASFGLPASALAADEDARRAALARLEALPAQALAEALGQASERGLLLVADQFERLFIECDDDARQHFIDVVIAAAEEDVKLVIALRADFYGLLLEDTRLAKAIEHSQLTLLPMTEEELIRAIEEPARVARRSFDAGLPERIAAHVGGRAGDLPLLEFALSELWDRDAAVGVLSEKTYELIGYPGFPGALGAIARRAEEEWRRFDKAEQAAARRVFISLVAAGSGDEPGRPIGAGTSRRAWLSELDDAGRQVAERLVSARLLATGRDPITDEATVEVAHEALFRAWGRLRGWVADYRDLIDWRVRELIPFWQRWIAQGRTSDFLLPPAALEQARSFMKRYPDELAGSVAEYIRASTSRTVNRRLRILSFAALVVIAAAAAVVIVRNLQETISGEERSGESRALARAADEALERQPALAALLSIEAAKVEMTPEARDSMLEVVERSPRALAVLRQGTPVKSLAFDGSGARLATAGGDGMVRRWNIAQRRMIGKPIGPVSNQNDPGHNAALGVAMSPGGSRLAAGGEDGTLTLIDMRSGDVLDSHEGFHEGPIVSVAFSRRGLVASAAGDAISLWRTRGDSLKLIRRLTRHEDFLATLAFSPSGNTLVSAADDRTIRFWRMPGGDPSRKPLVSRDIHVYSLTVGGGGFIAGGAGGAFLWDLDRPAALEPVITQSTVWSVAHHPDGKFIAAGGDDGAVVLLSRNDEEHLYGHEGEVDTVEFGRDGNLLASGSRDGTVRLWDTGRPWPLATVLDRKADPLDSIAFAPTGTTLVVGGANGTFRLWDAARREPLIRPRELGIGSIGAVAISSRGVAALAGSYGPIALVRTPSGSDVRRIPAKDAADTIAFSPDGETLAEGDEFTGIRLWETASATQRVPAPEVGNVGPVSLAFGPEGDTLVWGGRDGIHFWDVLENQPIAAKPSGETQGVTVGPNGEVASGDQQGMVRFWTIKGARLAEVDSAQEAGVTRLAFTADGSTLASTGEDDSSLRLWDVESHKPLGKPITTGAEPSAGEGGVAFSEDGSLLASLTSHGLLIWDRILWSTKLSAWRKRVCAIAGRNLRPRERREFLSGDASEATCSRSELRAE